MSNGWWRSVQTFGLRVPNLKAGAREPDLRLGPSCPAARLPVCKAPTDRAHAPPFGLHSRCRLRQVSATPSAAPAPRDRGPVGKSRHTRFENDTGAPRSGSYVCIWTRPAASKPAAAAAAARSERRRVEARRSATVRRAAAPMRVVQRTALCFGAAARRLLTRRGAKSLGCCPPSAACAARRHNGLLPRATCPASRAPWDPQSCASGAARRSARTGGRRGFCRARPRSR